MKILFLRGKVPEDRPSSEITFTTLSECDDMWTHLAYALSDGDRSEILYWGGNRKHSFTQNFTEIWVPKLEDYQIKDFCPDVIFCRGGFPEYDVILQKFLISGANPFLIYYGAGKRYDPHPTSNYIYDLILVDCYSQVYSQHSRADCFVWAKPAAENIFHPSPDTPKRYDAVFVANGTQNFKGHSFIYSTAPKDLNILHLGFPHKHLIPPPNITSKRVERKHLRPLICSARVGLVANEHHPDSSPRVVGELLACGIPIAMLESVSIHHQFYISSSTGILSSPSNFWNDVRELIGQNIPPSTVYNHYKNNSSMALAAKFITSQYLRRASKW